METQDNKKLGLWMNMGKALLVNYQNKEASLMETIDSPVESMIRYEGETDQKTKFGGQSPSSNENKQNNIHQEQVKKYFSLLEGKLSGYDEILLFGPGTAKKQFLNQLASNKAFSEVKFHIKDADNLTPNQLLSFVRNHFS